MYASDHPAEAAKYGQDLWGPHSIKVTDARPEHFHASMHGVLLRDVTLGYLDYGADATIAIRELTDHQLVVVPAVGTCTFEQAGETVTGSPVNAVVPTPNEPMTLQVSADAPLVVIRFDRTALDVHLSRLVGHLLDRPLHFDIELDLTPGSASRWNFAVQMLHAELFDADSLLHAGTGLGQLEEFAMSALLYSHRSNYTEQLLGEVSQERRAVRQAVDFIEQNLTQPIDVTAIASAAGVSVRTLQSFFATDLQQSPSAFVRNRRLERARAELADAPTGSGVTVTRVANRWGFTHLGRFATTYKQRFGETPSQTLKS